MRPRSSSILDALVVTAGRKGVVSQHFQVGAHSLQERGDYDRRDHRAHGFGNTREIDFGGIEDRDPIGVSVDESLHPLDLLFGSVATHSCVGTAARKSHARFDLLHSPV